MSNCKFIAWSGTIFFPLTLVLFLQACNKDKVDPDVLLDSNNPIVNPSFEDVIDFNNTKSIWKKYAWQASQAKFEWHQGIGLNQSNCISLASGATENDVTLMQDIVLEGEKVYRLTTWVKTKNVAGGRGANICLYGTWQSSEPLLGTNNWQQVSCTFITPESGKVTIACRLGYWGGTATGEAWFDDVRVQEVDMFDQQSQHFRLRLKNEDVSVISTATITNWLANLDKVYEKYY